MTITDNLDQLNTLRFKLEAQLEVVTRIAEAAHMTISSVQSCLDHVDDVLADLEHQRDLIVDHVFTDILNQPDEADEWEFHERLLGEEFRYLVEGVS